MSALKDLTDNMQTEWSSCASNILNARNQLYYAGNYIAAQEWALAKTALYLCGDLFGYAAGDISKSPPWGTGASEYTRDAFYWIDDNWPAGVEFDMDTLLSTMLMANPHQTLYFIGLVDAYRSSVWNRPFNEEYFAALARGFMLWP